ncbi:MAG: adventurous gliding motility protein CglE [Deltaproteobacteria bacterium]|nr:adventurous gliding motility protein CglE [Deltaproteobacteria bacterium]
MPHRLAPGPSAAPFVVFVLASPMLFAAGAAAQEKSSNAETPRAGEEVKGDTRVVEIDEVERGLSVGVDYGPAYYLPGAGAGSVNLNPTSTSPSTRVGVRVGYDLLNNLTLDAFVLGTFSTGVIDLDDVRDGKTTGDVALLAPGAGVRFAFITTERVFAFVRAGVGYALWFPPSLAGGATGSVHTDASLGVEYYTRLRHVSVGVEAAFQAILAPNAFGVHVYPTLKYTF